MKALTIRQPWASLVALGVKHIETRTRPAPKAMIGQHFAVHAGAHRPESVTGYTVWLPRGFGSEWFGMIQLPDEISYDLPLGAIVATARLVDCVPMVRSQHHVPEVTELHLVGDRPYIAHPGDEYGPIDVSDQLPYGDFTPGRWAWLLDDVKPTTERCPACMRTPGTPGLVAVKGYCDACMCLGKCPPIPAKGQLGFWTWTP